jgi:hypothetical protein
MGDVFAPKKHAAQLGVGIFEREIDVARTLSAQVGHFTGDPDFTHFLFQQTANRRGQIAHRQHTASRRGFKQFPEIPL